MAFFEVPGPKATGLRLAYDDEGEAPHHLVHGFRLEPGDNWKGPGCTRR